MIRYQCDKCNMVLHANDSQRFIVRMEVFAAAGHIDLDQETGEDGDPDVQAVLKDLAHANPDEIEDQTYRLLRFDLCDACRRTVLKKPLG